MPSGIGASIISVSPGTTIAAATANANWSALNTQGVSNDSGSVTTDGSGNMGVTSISDAFGRNRGIYMLASTYHLTTNPTVNSGNTTTLTCTGGSTGVPSGAVAVLLGVGIFASIAGGYVTVAPHGGTQGQYFGLSAPVANQYTLGFAIAPLSGGGQIDVKANAANMVLQDWYIIGYIA